MVYRRFMKGIVFVAAMVMAGGCTWVGIHTPKDEGPSTAEFRYETEMIPNSELVRDNTSPDWQLGRYTFRRGADRLLVVSRFTSSMERLSDEELNQGKTPQRYEWKLERVWITLPLGTPIGDRLMLEELERSFLVGYDEGELKDGAYRMFRQPNKVLGTVTVLEESPDSVVVDLQMRVEPKRSPSWDLRNDKLTVPIAVSGIHAKPTEAALKPVPYDTILPDVQLDDDDTIDLGDVAPPQDDDLQRPDDDADNQSVVGPWEMLVGNWEHRIQFDPDGRFIHASTRGISPMVRKGQYAIRSGFIVLTYEKFYGQNKDGSEGLDHMKFINKKIVAVRPQWVGKDLILYGDLQGIEKGKPPYRLRPGTYQDLNFVPMPNEMRPEFQNMLRNR